VNTSSLHKPMYPHISGPSRTNCTTALVARQPRPPLLLCPASPPCHKPSKIIYAGSITTAILLRSSASTCRLGAPLEHCQPAETHSLNPLPYRMNQPTHVKTSHTPPLRGPPATANVLRYQSDPTVYNSKTLPGYSIY
jgi:hypothetical protein